MSIFSLIGRAVCARRAKDVADAVSVRERDLERERLWLASIVSWEAAGPLIFLWFVGVGLKEVLRAIRRGW